VFSYLGFRQALEFGGEAKNAQKDVPRALIFSVIIAIVLYFFLQLAFTGAIKLTGTGASVWGVLGNSVYSSGPFYEVFKQATVAGFGAWAVILLIDGVISPSGTGWVYLGTATRVFYGLSTDGYYPAKFRSVNKQNGIPVFALLLSLVVGSIFIAPFPSWAILVGFISSATVFTYIMGGIALRHLRKTAKDLKRPFRLPYSQILAPIGFVSAALIVYWSGFTLEILLVYAIFAGLPIYIMFYATKALQLKKSLSYTAGILFWVIEAVTFYFMYYNVISPARNNLFASTPVPAPAEVFTYFPIMFIIFAIAVIAVTFFLYSQAKNGTRKEIRSGLWLVGFILTLMPLSFYGAFGPYLSPTPPNTAPLYFPWDNLVVIIDGLIFYFLALRSGYGEEDVQDILREEGVPMPEPALVTGKK
jgi:hypothetical protein